MNEFFIKDTLYNYATKFPDFQDTSLEDLNHLGFLKRKKKIFVF